MVEQPEQPEEVEVLSGPGGAEKERPFLDRPSVRGLWERRSARGRAVIAATTVAVLALGGTVAYAATSNGSGGDSASPSAASSSASSSPSSPGREGGPGFGGPWRGLGGDAVHGEATVKDGGDWVVRVWQRGTVEKVAGDKVTVKSEDGASWTWTVPSDTRVSGDDSGTGAGALKKGDTVFVAGTRSGDTRTAEWVFSGKFKDRGVKDRGGFKDRGPGGDRHGGGFGGHGGPWNRGGSPSPAPTGSGAAT